MEDKYANIKDWYCDDCKYLNEYATNDFIGATCEKYNEDLVFYDWYHRCEKCLEACNSVSEVD